MAGSSINSYMLIEIKRKLLSIYKYISPLKVVNIDIFRYCKTCMLNKALKEDWQSNNLQVIYV